MAEKEYIVTVKAGVDLNAFDAEMVASFGDETIPNRSVEIANARPASQRNTHYYLSDDEATTLANDNRVIAVEIPPDQRDDIQIELKARQSGTFYRGPGSAGNLDNWGLKRCTSLTENYGNGSTPSGDQNITQLTDDYLYPLDGTGVDVVIQDSGIQADHPEWEDANGVSRLVELDWYTASGVSGTMPAGHYTDYNGHGTHCAGTVAGKTFGWAKNSKIYAVKINGLQGATDPNGGIPISDIFDVIKEWHNNKPVTSTGYKRPTIVNMSWGYGTNIPDSVTPVGGVYRGTTWFWGTTYNTTGQLWSNVGIVPYYNGRWKIPVQVPSVDADVEELINAGVHVCIAAGNDYYKVTTSGEIDYNNTVSWTSYGTQNYHRPPSPYATGAFNVGNINSIIKNDQDAKAYDSMSGPAVTIWAPGTNIISACSNVSEIGGPTPYKLDPSFGQQSISGTSMASPQVCGVGALHLQAKPELTPAQLRQEIEANSPPLMLSTGFVNDYAAYTTSILGSEGRILYNKYNTDESHKIEGSVTITNLGIA